MSEPHVIRLREPWHREPLPGGGVRYRRYFNLPTGLTQTTTVTIVCDAPKAAAAVALNGASLGICPVVEAAWSCEVKSLLVVRNELAFDVPSLSSPNLPWREVRLEIREP